MKRRQNFLFSTAKPYEVRIYIYGKAGFEARGEQNIKRKKFTDLQAAKRWLDANRDYPLVELVDLKKDHIVFSGGTGRKFNPRKQRKQRTPKRRDVYAEMAKSRKTTKGHTRKDRKRSVARGSSRKPKHKIRLNPVEYEKPNLGATVFATNVKKRQSKILGMYRGFLAALEREGVKKLPSAGEIRDDATQGAVLIESTRYPELRSQSKEARGAQDVAAEVLGIGPGGEFAAYAQTYPEIFELHLNDTVELLKKERKKLRASELKDAKRIDKAREDFTQERASSTAAKIAAIEAQIESKKGEIADYEDDGDYEDEDEGELDADTAADLGEFYDMTPGEKAEKEQLQEDAQREKAVKKGRKKRKKTVEYDEGEYTPPTAGMSKRKLERLGKYATHLTPVRRTDVQPPLNLLGKTRQDVLLYILKDGTTQVWMKGSMTVTFEPTGRIPSWTIAHRYANKWRGLSPSGSVRGPKEGELPVKKSRLRTGVYAAVEGQDKLKKIEDPINIVEKKDRTLKRKQYDMPDLDKYELTGDRANPRRRKNIAFDWEKTADGYYLPGQAVSFLVKKEAIKVRGRRKQMWALYANRHEDAREKGWKLWLNNIQTLTKAKDIVREYVGRAPATTPQQQVSPAGRPPLMPNPRRRKNTGFGEEGPKLTWKDWCASIRSELRAYRSGGTARTWRGQKSWSMEDFKAEVSRLYRKPADEILKEFWRDDPTDPTYLVEGVADDLDFESRFPEHRISNPKRRKNVAFGKGKPEQNHPYANILRSEGLTYSHSVPVTHSGGKVYHHVYRLDDTDFYVSYYQKPGGTKWLWEGSVSGSGRMHQGFGMSALGKYLRGAVPRHRAKVAREREAYEYSSAIMSGFSPPNPRRRR